MCYCIFMSLIVKEHPAGWKRVHTVFIQCIN